jgi:hypothetical protein
MLLLIIIFNIMCKKIFTKIAVPYAWYSLGCFIRTPKPRALIILPNVGGMTMC